MNSELAKQLKDAGFPQHEGHDYYDHSCDKGVLVNACIPTLSELIKVCGRMDFKLRQTYSAYENKIFYVIEIPGADDMERCDTPEEAVANLYLRLNAK